MKQRRGSRRRLAWIAGIAVAVAAGWAAVAELQQDADRQRPGGADRRADSPIPPDRSAEAGGCPSLGSFGVGQWPPACWRPYADSSPFNRPLSSNPRVKGNSAAIVANLIAAGGPGPSELIARPGDRNDGGVPIYWSQPGDPLMTLDCGQPPQQCPIDGMRLRIPAAAQPSGGYDDPSRWSHDAHMAVVDQQSGWEYDFYNVRPPSGSAFRFDTGGRTRIDGNGLGPPANAARYGLLGGPIRIQELRAGVINHALAMYIPCTSGVWVYPATEDGRVCPDSLPPNPPNPDQPSMGARFQLDISQAQIDALGAPGWQKAIYTALRKYGAYVSDTAASDSPSWSFEIESPATYESFDGYRGSSNPWVRFARRLGIDGVDFNRDDHDEYWFSWTTDGTRDGPLSIDWQGKLRVLDECSARGTC